MTKQIIGELQHTKKYIPKRDELYHYIGDYGNISKTGNICTSADKWIMRRQPVFLLEDDCKIYKQYLELLDEYTFEPDWKDTESKKYHIIYNHDIKEIDYDHSFAKQHQKYYFETLELADEFIEKVGEQNIKRFMFDIWE